MTEWVVIYTINGVIGNSFTHINANSIESAMHIVTESYRVNSITIEGVITLELYNEIKDTGK